MLLPFAQGSGWALDRYELTGARAIYGTVLKARITEGQTLLDLARKFGIGYNQITAANPSVDPWVPEPGIDVLIPKIVVLPRGLLPEGITINLAEMRLFFTKRGSGGRTLLYTCPIGIGKSGFSTKTGLYTVRSKAEDPTWYVPESIRRLEPDLPPVVPPGPDNPLGRYILRFSRHAYGIHGTNRPLGIGRRVSHGCIRCYPEDIEQLYPLVEVGSLINIVYEPIKAVYQDGSCWLQVFEDYENRLQDPFSAALMAVDQCRQEAALLGREGLKVDLRALKQTVSEHTGLPVAVTGAKGPES